MRPLRSVVNSLYGMLMPSKIAMMRSPLQFSLPVDDDSKDPKGASESKQKKAKKKKNKKGKKSKKKKSSSSESQSGSDSEPSDSSSDGSSSSSDTWLLPPWIILSFSSTGSLLIIYLFVKFMCWPCVWPCMS